MLNVHKRLDLTRLDLTMTKANSMAIMYCIDIYLIYERMGEHNLDHRII